MDVVDYKVDKTGTTFRITMGADGNYLQKEQVDPQPGPSGLGSPLLPAAEKIREESSPAPAEIMSVAGSQTAIVGFDNDSLEGSDIEIGDDDGTIGLTQGAVKERRGRGRPPTTWEHVGKKEKEEEKARLKEAEKERLAAESLKPTAPKGRKWSQLLDQEEELEARLNETPTENIASRLMKRSVTAFNIAKCPNSLKGSLVKELQEIAVLMRAATNVMATRVRKAQEGKMERLLKKVEELQAENIRLKGEMEQVKIRLPLRHPPLPHPQTAASAP